jgi:hypothetical protein
MFGNPSCVLRPSAPVPIALLALGLLVSDAAVPAHGQEAARSVEQTQRLEGEAILALADAALAGKRVPSDFRVGWQNEFLKAQRGTFVPFTLTIDASPLTRPAALVYVRAIARGEQTGGDRRAAETGRSGKGQDAREAGEYPVDAIFPVVLRAEPGQRARISRGFSLAPGEYDLYVVVRERADPANPRHGSKAAVLKQAISVPDFRAGGLTTSSVILADRLDVLNAPVPADELAERPYVIGQHDITPAADTTFRRSEELIVVFLVYSPTVTSEKNFDLQVEYYFYLKGRPGPAGTTGPQAPHPPEREGERYFNHTDPQRFNPTVLGAQFDATGHPVMAGQGVPLAGFEQGDYRLAIRITDLLAGTSILRDVYFRVGS